MARFNIGDRVIMRHPDLDPAGVVGRVAGRWHFGQNNPLVKAGGLGIEWRPAGDPWHAYDDELTLAPSHRAEVGVDGPAAVYCYCAKESPLSTYTASEGHYQEEGE